MSRLLSHEEYVLYLLGLNEILMTPGSEPENQKCKYIQTLKPESSSYSPTVRSLLCCQRRSGRREHRTESQKMHPIMCLPPELMGHIFVLVSEDDIMMPFVVSHVCRAWRVVALHTPSLWRRISLDSRLQMWTERIPRARACSLDIEIRPQTCITGARVRRHYLDARMVQLYMHLVSPYLGRWRSLTVEFHHYAPYLWAAALACCSGSSHVLHASRLEHLALQYRSNDDTREYTLFNGQAPRLRSVTLDGIRLTWLPSLFANLTVLDYTHHGFTRGHDAEGEIFRMLSVSSRLHELHLAFPAYSFKTVDTRSCLLPSKASLYLDNLLTLTLEVGSADIPSALIQLLFRLQLRNLQSLHLLSMSHLPTQDLYCTPPFSRLQKMLKALNRLPRLTYLQLDPAWCEPSFIVGLLNFHVPRLRHLSICSPRIDNSILWVIGETCRARYRVMYPPAGSLPVVVFQPLEVLELVGSQRLSEDGVLEVVRRMLGGGMLWVGELWLKDCKGVAEEVVKRAARMGVSVRIWHDGKESLVRNVVWTKPDTTVQRKTRLRPRRA
jgi:hypothetical protein